MRARISLLLAALLLTAGCIGADEETEDQVEEPPVDTGEDRGLDFQLTPDTEEPETLTLDEPPVWRSGEWWRIRFTSALTGESFEFTRVVTGVEGQNYLVGMPRDDWVDAVMIYHVPGMGEVRQNDLSYEVHDVRFEPLKFPLEDGGSWKTSFEGRPMESLVTVENETVATVQLTGPNDHLTLTYDASARTITEFSKDGYGHYEVLEHGTGWEGIVTVPHMHDLTFLDFRVAGALDGNLEPAPPVKTVEVDTTYDRVSFITVVGTVLPSPEAPQAVYVARATAPDGTVYEHVLTPADEAGVHLGYHQHDQPGGEWQLEIVAGGPGIAGVEGIGYHVYDVDLPSGRILPSTGEHEHGDHD